MYSLHKLVILVIITIVITMAPKVLAVSNNNNNVDSHLKLPIEIHTANDDSNSANNYSKKYSINTRLQNSTLFKNNTNNDLQHNSSNLY